MRNKGMTTRGLFGILLLTLALAGLQLAAVEQKPMAGDEEASKDFTTDMGGAELCRGNYLRTDIRDKKVRYEMVPSLVIDGADRQPVLVLRRHRVVEQTEVRLYETMMRFFVRDKDGAGYFDYKRVQDEVWEGEKNVRIIPEEDGVLANMRVQIDDMSGHEIACHTDAQGRLAPDKGWLDLLEPFDDLSCRTKDYFIQCIGISDDAKKLDGRLFRLYRTMPQRKAFDEKRLQEPPEQDLLCVYGLDFQPSQLKPEQDALVCTVAFPENFAYATAGKPLPIRVRVQNNGDYQTSCLIGRLFSRVQGVDGKLFYFGAVKPGESVEFTRFVTVPVDLRTGKVYAELRFSDSWDAPKLSVPIKFTVVREE